ncbi:ribosomal-processing cysteine protease Prp [Ileibacterium valens]|uniref:ribosomal-processing cysteine protease Prp n=1 Tax=Ileibacterium valens TaxID=1862668 RepID=UPI0024BA254B|nr:ribosomal-processing cysteine protease Prp [Ileibacterium valens]
MIRIESDKRSYLRITGHAGYADVGTDIVCAGISALYETLCLKIEETAPGLIQINPLDMDYRLMLETIASGMEQIARQYPEYVEFELF